MQQPSPVKKREGFMRRLTKRFHVHHDRDDMATAGPPAAGATAQSAAAPASMSRRHSLTDALPSTAISATLLPTAISLKQPVSLLKPPQPEAPQPISTSANSSAQSFRRHSSAPIVSDNSAALQPTATTATMSASSTESSSSSNQLVKSDSARLDAVSESGDEVFDECEYNEDEDVEEYDDDVENEENQNLNTKSQQELNRLDSASKKNKNPISITLGLATAEGLMGHDNEDRMIVEQNEDFHLLAVLDGHGGGMVADFVKDHLFPAIARCYDHGFNLQELSDTIDSLDQQAQAKAQQILDYSGACLICVLLYTDEATGVPQTLTLNVGDCRAIMHEARGKGKKDNKGVGPNGKLYALSQDHCESNSKEKARVIASGAVIEYGRIGGVLEPFRSIGDIDMKEREMDGWVIATPEIKKTRLLVGRSTLVLATDGVWGSLVNQKVMALARKFANDPQAAADAIVTAAREAGSFDDIAVVIAKV